jgi:hypothetical protein
MSLSATSAAVPDEPTETRKLLLLIWSLTIASYLLTGRGAEQGISTDDAMRLVQVRDLLAGQGWFDLTQYRLSPPDGVAMHWSRLIDLPIAILLRTAELVLPAATAERLVLTVWPAALLLVLLFGVARMARELADDTAARLAIIFAAMVGPLLQHFRPGAIDHHGAQLALLVWSVALSMGERPRDAALAGALCALSLAIGQEMAPAIAGIAGFIAVRWIVRGAASRASAAAFGLSFAALTVVLFIATILPARYMAATCDALSIVQVSTAVCGGIGLAIIALWRSLTTVPTRVAAAAGLGLLIAAIALVAFPGCLRDPYAGLDPRLDAYWLSHVSETRNITAVIRDLPQHALHYYGLPVIALALGLYRSWRETGIQQWAWIGTTIVMAITALIAAWQMRGSAAANVLALAVAAAALVRGFPAPSGGAIFFGLGRAALVAALLISPFALLGAGQALAWTFEHISGRQRPTVISSGGPGTCQLAADYAPLARLPRGLVLGFIDAGPMVLMETPHSVLAAPFHRNVKGNVASFDIFLAHPDDAVRRMAALGVDYVIVCPGAPDRRQFAAAAPDGLAEALSRGDIPEGLERLALERTDLMVFRRR